VGKTPKGLWGVEPKDKGKKSGGFPHKGIIKRRQRESPPQKSETPKNRSGTPKAKDSPQRKSKLGVKIGKFRKKKRV